MPRGEARDGVPAPQSPHEQLLEGFAGLCPSNEAVDPASAIAARHETGRERGRDVLDEVGLFVAGLDR